MLKAKDSESIKKLCALEFLRKSRRIAKAFIIAELSQKKVGVGKVSDNLLKRGFRADKPLEKLKTDVTKFNICDEKVYLSPVIHMFNRTTTMRESC